MEIEDRTGGRDLREWIGAARAIMHYMRERVVYRVAIAREEKEIRGKHQEGKQEERNGNVE